MNPPVECGNCGRDVQPEVAEYCWYCGGPLCGNCWEDTGHCGHQDAFALDARLRERVGWRCS